MSLCRLLDLTNRECQENGLLWSRCPNWETENQRGWKHQHWKKHPWLFQALAIKNDSILLKSIPFWGHVRYSSCKWLLWIFQQDTNYILNIIKLQKVVYRILSLTGFWMPSATDSGCEPWGIAVDTTNQYIEQNAATNSMKRTIWSYIWLLESLSNCLLPFRDFSERTAIFTGKPSVALFVWGCSRGPGSIGGPASKLVRGCRFSSPRVVLVQHLFENSITTALGGTSWTNLWTLRFHLNSQSKYLWLWNFLLSLISLSSPPTSTHSCQNLGRVICDLHGEAPKVVTVQHHLYHSPGLTGKSSKTYPILSCNTNGSVCKVSDIIWPHEVEISKPLPSNHYHH